MNALKEDMAKLSGAWAIADAVEELPPLLDDDVTVMRYAARHGYSEDKARRILNRKANNHELLKVKCCSPKGWEFAYREPVK